MILSAVFLKINKIDKILDKKINKVKKKTRIKSEAKEEL